MRSTTGTLYRVCRLNDPCSITGFLLTTLHSRSEKEYEDVTSHGNTKLSGLCTGLFAATAIASSYSLSTLLPIATQVVLMAFRTGSHVASLAERLSPSTEKSESWTYVLPAAQEAEAKSILAEFHKHTLILTPTDFQAVNSQSLQSILYI